MKDFLLETIKLEGKIRYGALLKDYYAGNITWNTFLQESDKLQGLEKALTEEANVKPQFRTELENQMYPLDYWIRKVGH